MQSIVDPVFGKLELGSIWTGEVRLPLFEKTFGLEIVNPDKEPPDDMLKRLLASIHAAAVGNENQCAKRTF